MKPFRVGDYIVSKDGEGTVTAIGLVYTTLNTVDNKRVVIPNGNLANSPLTNVTAKEKRRVDILVGIGYSSDLKKAKAVSYTHLDVYKRQIYIRCWWAVSAGYLDGCRVLWWSSDYTGSL